MELHWYLNSLLFAVSKVYRGTFPGTSEFLVCDHLEIQTGCVNCISEKLALESYYLHQGEGINIIGARPFNK